jgi:hypothetical protein
MSTNRLGIKKSFIDQALKLQSEYGVERIGTLADQHVRDLFPKGTSSRAIMAIKRRRLTCNH